MMMHGDEKSRLNKRPGPLVRRLDGNMIFDAWNWNKTNFI